MTSMSLKFILCAPEETIGTRTRKQQKITNELLSAQTPDNLESRPTAAFSYSPYVAGRQKKDDTASVALDRQQHTRQLQNLRQRRYRERKKSSASALQTKSELLHQENSALEAAIVEHFKSLA